MFHWVSPVSVQSTGSGHIVTPLKELLRSPSPSCGELRVEFGTSRVIRRGLSVNLDSLAPPYLALLAGSSLLHSVLPIFSPLLSSPLPSGAAEGALRDTVCVSVWMMRIQINLRGGGFPKTHDFPRWEEGVRREC